MAGKRGGRNSRARSPRAGTNNSDSNSNRQNGNIKNKKKKDVLKRERTRLDDVLTVIFVLLVLSVFYHVRDDREWMLTLIASLASVAVVIFASKTLFRGIGGFISDRLLNSSWTLIDDRRPLRKKQTMKKFTDQAWQVGRQLSPLCGLSGRERFPARCACSPACALNGACPLVFLLKYPGLWIYVLTVLGASVCFYAFDCYLVRVGPKSNSSSFTQAWRLWSSTLCSSTPRAGSKTSLTTRRSAGSGRAKTYPTRA